MSERVSGMLADVVVVESDSFLIRTIVDAVVSLQLHPVVVLSSALLANLTWYR